jgi:hypothetical protein
MIPEERWNSMTPEQQADAWWAELDGMLTVAMDDLVYTADNEDTIVINGLTTIVGERIAVTPP